MGHFTIALPDNVQGDVRWGTIKKKSLLLAFFKSKRSNNEVRKGYIVRIALTPMQHKEYRLLKTPAGDWTAESHGGFQVTPEDEISASIKLAIDHYEGRH